MKLRLPDRGLIVDILPILGEGAKRPKIVLCVAASDSHVVGNQLIAMFLRDHGFDVINLGAATSVSEMMEACRSHRDVLALVIGSMNGHAVDDLAGL
jgi:methylaspartate mutase sigma subunit